MYVVSQELLNRSALETQKLELMTEVSSLKLKLTAVERDHRDNEVQPCPEHARHVKPSRDSRDSLSAPAVVLYDV